jgi:hypothetical protein
MAECNSNTKEKPAHTFGTHNTSVKSSSSPFIAKSNYRAPTIKTISSSSANSKWDLGAENEEHVGPIELIDVGPHIPKIDPYYSGVMDEKMNITDLEQVYSNPFNNKNSDKSNGVATKKSGKSGLGNHVKSKDKDAASGIWKTDDATKRSGARNNLSFMSGGSASTWKDDGSFRPQSINFGESMW